MLFSPIISNFPDEKLGDEDGMVTLVVTIELELLRIIEMAIEKEEKEVKEKEKKEIDVTKEELSSVKGDLEKLIKIFMLLANINTITIIIIKIIIGPKSPTISLNSLFCC